MTKKHDLPTLFHQILFPIIMVGLTDLRYSEEELADLKATANGMGDWFDMDTDESMTVVEETYLSVQNAIKKGNLRNLFDTALVCCAVINQEIENDEVKENIIQLMHDQANADGILTGEEENTLAVYSGIIRLGGEPFGIKI